MSEPGSKYLKKICDSKLIEKLADKANILNTNRPNQIFTSAWCSLAKLFPPIMTMAMK